MGLGTENRNEVMFKSLERNVMKKKSMRLEFLINVIITFQCDARNNFNFFVFALQKKAQQVSTCIF